MVKFYEKGDIDSYLHAYHHLVKKGREDVAVDFPIIFFESVSQDEEVDKRYLFIEEFEPKISSLRQDEYFSIFLISADEKVEFIVSYSSKVYTVYEALMNIFRTMFICLVLSFAALFFNKGAQELVLNPLERMIEKVKIIAKNPQIAASEEIDKIGLNPYQKHPEKRTKEENQYETVVLEKAIVKIGHLLALGLGEAGSMIIGQNMTQGGDLDPIIPGNKEHCIFGFCIIDDFTETTEAL